MKRHLPKRLSMAGVALLATLCMEAAKERPNVIFFALDDLNDWINPMGCSQAITPNMDRLAKLGVTFQNAHTAGSYCAPSRSAIFTGRHASTTGCYTGQVYYHNLPEVTPLQLAFQKAGYLTYGAGKLFHHPKGFIDQRGWDAFYLRSEEQRQNGWALDSWTLDDPILPDPYPASIFNHDRKPANQFFLEWGPVLNENEEKMADTMRTNWACEILKQRHDQPFFLAVGLYTPHFPNYAPKKYFDLYDREKIELPPYLESDLEDLPDKVRKAKTGRSAHHRRLEKLDAIEDAILGYLACVSYADAMLGRVLDALAEGPNSQNTILVLWSDHGYHHGEKFDWGKHTLWERTSNVPFMWAGPGIAHGESVDASASLIDMYPTLLELCSIPHDSGLDGVSVVDVLKQPSSAQDRSVLLSGMKPNEYAIMNQDWRYIRYADGTEELYDVRKDPNEWTNLASNPEFDTIIAKLASEAPETFAEPGLAVNQLRLVVDGETYRWELKEK